MVAQSMNSSNTEINKTSYLLHLGCRSAEEAQEQKWKDAHHHDFVKQRIELQKDEKVNTN